MTTFHNFALRIETGWATRVVNRFWKLEMSLIDAKLNETCLIWNKQIKSRSWNGFEVSQNNILYVFCYKSVPFGVKRPWGTKGTTMKQLIVTE